MTDPEAVERAEPDKAKDELAERIAQTYGRYLGIALTAGLGTVALVILITDSLGIRLGPPGARERSTAEEILLSVTPVLMIAALVWLARRRYWRRLRQSLTWIIPRAEKRRLRAAVRRDELPPDLDRAHLRAMAEWFKLQREGSPITGCVLLMYPRIIADGFPATRVVFGAILLAIVVGFGMTLRDGWAADRFLARPEMADAGVDAGR